MGFFSSSSNKPDAATTVTTNLTPSPVSPKDQRRLDQQREQDELDRILAGAPNNGAKLADLRSFSRANVRHAYADCAWGVAAYTFSGLQHVHGQSTALTLLSMWAAGTTFLVNAAMRGVLAEASQAMICEEERAGGTGIGSPDAVGATETDSIGAGSIRSSSMRGDNAAAVLSGKQRLRAEEEQQRRARQQGPRLPIASGADFDSQRRNVFQPEAVGSWIWLLASLQQFRIHKRLKWCGYSSWMGLGCAVYYTFRHMYHVLVR